LAARIVADIDEDVEAKQTKMVHTVTSPKERKVYDCVWANLL
jgi:hypothetical protein